MSRLTRSLLSTTLLSTALSITVVGCALLLAWLTHNWIDLVPKLLLDATGVIVSRQDFLTIALIYVAWHAPAFALMFAWTKEKAVLTAHSAVWVMYALAFASSWASGCIFLLTAVNFSPNFFLMTGIYSGAGFLVVHYFFQRARGQKEVISKFLRELMRVMLRPVAVVIYVVAAVPVALAGYYTADREFANAVHNLRLSLSSSISNEWALVNAFPGTVFSQPIELQFPVRKNDKVYVLERQGRIYAVTFAKKPVKELILDISAEVGQATDENGALGFALHPAFGEPGSSERGHVFVYYTHPMGRTQLNRLSRFDVSKGTVEERAASEVRLFELGRNSSGAHNGGSVEFGPDGFLYIGMGEATDRRNHQTITRSLFSGIMRIDVDMKGPPVSRSISRQPVNGKTGNYFIPLDNPFVGFEHALEEFWAIGLRNPFRFDFDSKTGVLWTGDVGGGLYEEVNQIVKGGNYEYPVKEGPDMLAKWPPQKILGGLRGPYYYYRHSALDRAIIGGTVYREGRYGSLNGWYIFADNYSGKVLAIDASMEVPTVARVLARTHELGQYGIASLKLGPNGDLLIATLGSAKRPSGRVWALRRLGDIDRSLEKSEMFLADPTQGSVAESASEIFRGTCARCHGLSGKGNDGDSLDFVGEIIDFTDSAWQHSRSDADIFTVIKHGGPARGLSDGMPPWGEAYSDDMISQLVKHVRQLGTFEPGETE